MLEPDWRVHERGWGYEALIGCSPLQGVARIWMPAPAFCAARFWGQLLRRDGVHEIVRAEGRASELVREGRKEEGRGEQREKANRSLRGERGRELQAAKLDYCSNTAVFLLLLWGNCLLPAHLSFLFLLILLLGHDPSGHLDLLAHLEKRREML